MKDIRLKYLSQKTKAKHRGIDFNLTFEEWWDIWQQSGKWEQRGCRKGQYVMSRIGDKGAYEVGNVFIQTSTQNCLERPNGPGWNKGKKQSPELIEKRRIARWGKKEIING